MIVILYIHTTGPLTSVDTYKKRRTGPHVIAVVVIVISIGVSRHGIVILKYYDL